MPFEKTQKAFYLCVTAYQKPTNGFAFTAQVIASNLVV